MKKEMLWMVYKILYTTPRMVYTHLVTSHLFLAWKTYKAYNDENSQLGSFPPCHLTFNL